MKAAKLIAGTAVALSFLIIAAGTSWASGGGPSGGGPNGGGSLEPGGVGAVAGAPGGDGRIPVSYTPPPPNPAPAGQSGYSYQYQGRDPGMVCLDNGAMVPYQTSPTGIVITPPARIQWDLYSLRWSISCMAPTVSRWGTQRMYART